MRLTRATLYTDPFCPWSWAAEPALRRLRAGLGDALELRWVVVGLARTLDDPAALALAALDAADASGMPVDPRVFLRDPPASTYPAGLAVHAVSEQVDPSRYLRRLREAILLERRRMDRADALLDAAREILAAEPGLDLERLRVDFGSNAIVERFGEDLERARAVDPAHHEPGTGRVRLPSLEVLDDDGGVHGAYGTWRWEDWKAAVEAAGAQLDGAAPPVEEALRRHGPLATPEVAALCDLPGPLAAAELWRLATEWRAQSRRVLGGELWSAA
jgi:putative protein-disulfide isomerase